jgi:N-acetylglucosamine kinase-like BadF-type ATPase
MRTLVFGADGGGTKTLGILAEHEGKILTQRTVGATNVNVVGIDRAAQTLYGLLQACCSDAGCEMEELRAIVLGLAGAGREENRDGLRERLCALAGRPLPLFIETDARVALEGAFDGGPGVVMIAGTGSIVMGKNAAGEIACVGGWGRVLGDEGSGYWLGREAVRALTRYYDGRNGSSVLAEMFGREFGLDSRERIVAAVYQERFDFAALASAVLRAAEMNDSDAMHILTRGASELVEQVRAVVERFSDAARIALVGSLIEKENVYSRIVKEQVTERIPSAAICKPLHSPAAGAVLMGTRRLRTS